MTYIGAAESLTRMVRHMPFIHILDSDSGGAMLVKAKFFVTGVTVKVLVVLVVVRF